MTHTNQLQDRMDIFTEEDAPALFHAWQAVKHAPDNSAYREHLLLLLDRFNFEEEYELILREGIETCPAWEEGPALLATWQANRERYRERLYKASQVADNNAAEVFQASNGVLDYLAQMKQKSHPAKRMNPQRTKPMRRPAKKPIKAE